GLSGVTAIAAGGAHSLALRSDGTVVAWGGGGIAAYGQGRVLGGLSGVTAVAAGVLRRLALRSDGAAVPRGCGLAPAAQCIVPAGLSGVGAISAGRFHNLALIPLADQTIAFPAPPGKTYGDADFTVSATASSGLAVSLAATGNCSVSGATVHLTVAGSCTLTASQAGDASHNPAQDVSQTFAIAKADQSIAFVAPARKTFGAPDFTVEAAASSG